MTSLSPIRAADPGDSGEICLFEIDAAAVRQHSTTARVGIKAHHDPRLTLDMTQVDVPVGQGQPHTWSTRWDGSGVVIACQGQVVYTSPEQLCYPLQLMVDLFEIGPPQARALYPKTALVHRVRGG